MPTYIGFSTQNVDAVRQPQVNTGVDGGAGSLNNPIRYTKKFRTLDQQIVIQDFLNSLNITQGQLPGRPEFGTTLWAFIFEPNVLDTQVQIENEIRRVAALDPRITLNSVRAYPQGNGILLEVEITIEMIEDPVVLQILLDQNAQNAQLL
jgi:phage baseplate assembly protein W